MYLPGNNFKGETGSVTGLDICVKYALNYYVWVDFI